MISFDDIFIYSDQPATCPICGARTENILNLLHTNSKAEIEKCMAPSCGFEFVLKEDEEYGVVGGKNL